MIRLIVPFFGKIPNYFPFFVESARYQTGYEFLIFTDDTSAKSLAPNVRIVPMTLAEFNERARHRLGIAAKIEARNAYKICDWRPAVGLLFEEYLTDADYFGFCDIDIILGSLGRDFTTEFLAPYDLISMRREWISGSFCLMKNNSRMRSLFKESPDWEKVFLSSWKHFCFDEAGPAEALAKLRTGTSIFDVKNEVVSFTHVVRQLEASQTLRVHFANRIIEIGHLKNNIHWKGGEFREIPPGYDRLTAYYHFVLQKKASFYVPPVKYPVESIWINSWGIFQSEHELQSRTEMLKRRWLSFLRTQKMRIDRRVNRLRRLFP